MINIWFFLPVCAGLVDLEPAGKFGRNIGEKEKCLFSLHLPEFIYNSL